MSVVLAAGEIARFPQIGKSSPYTKKIISKQNANKQGKKYTQKTAKNKKPKKQ